MVQARVVGSLSSSKVKVYPQTPSDTSYNDTLCIGREADKTPHMLSYTNLPTLYNRGSEETRAQTVPASWTWIELVSTSSEHAAAVSTIFGYSAKLLPRIRKLTGRSDVIIVATTSFSDINFSSLMLTGVTGCGFP